MNNVFLIACSAKKLQTQNAVSVVELYQGQLFKAQLAYARNVLGALNHQIYVMSAKHHLVSIHTRLLPYDDTLVGKPLKDREKWARRVCDDLRRQHCCFFECAYLMGGRLYTDPLTAAFRSYGYASSIPHPAGLGYAKQVQWYKEQVTKCSM